MPDGGRVSELGAGVAGDGGIPGWLDPPDPAEHARRCAMAFAERVGAFPDGLWAAPGRVNLIGEHLDYNGGPVLPVALEHRTMVAVRRRRDRAFRLWSLGGANRSEPRRGELAALRPGAVTGWAAYPAGVLWALGESARQGRNGAADSATEPAVPGVDIPGVDIVVDGRVPVGAGLSSSAALTCAVALAVADLAGLPGADRDDEAGRRTLAAACVRAENELVGAPTGGMDQAIALRARAGNALLLDCATFDGEVVPFDPAAAGLALLVVDTRAHHELVDGQYGERRAACERAARLLGVARLAELSPGDLGGALRRLAEGEAGAPARAVGHDPAAHRDHGEADELGRTVRHVVTETARVRQVVDRLRAGDVAGVGQDLTASHASLRDDYRVSCPELDAAVTAALAGGALGARLTGGGFGGSVIALCPQEAQADVAASIVAAFDAAGFPRPRFLPCRPAGPGGRVA